MVERPTSPSTPAPTRIYLISARDCQGYKEPAYSTDPRTYGVLQTSDLSNEQYETAKAGLKAFVNRDDAIAFAYHCNLVSVMCPVFDRVGDKWVFNEAETSRMADDIN
jgi:hypothetical protein